MAPKTTNLAIMFADISGSTQLYESLGDAVARKKVAECLELMGEVVRRYHGVVIKTIGDEVMSTFPSAEDAVTAACEMHEELSEDITERSNIGETTISIRVGLHFGPAIMDSGDVFGDAVNIAARMAAQAKANQIITTQNTIDLLPPVLRASTRYVDKAPVKGKRQAIDIYEVIWQQEDVTRMATGVLASERSPSHLFLTYGDQRLLVNEENPEVVLGRSVTANLTVNEKLASRQHVKVTCRRGKFYIIDQSTNGTYFKADGGQETFVRREELPLSGCGQISLGRAFSEAPSEIVRYEIDR